MLDEFGGSHIGSVNFLTVRSSFVVPNDRSVSKKNTTDAAIENFDACVFET